MTPAEEIANWEIFLWVLQRLGGSTGLVDVETVFYDCFQVAPQRFSWRTRADLPDYKKCSKALRDAEARKPRLLVKTGDSFKRQLTVEGQQWVEANQGRLQRLLESGRVIQEPKHRPRARHLAEVERSAEFLQWQTAGVLPDEKWRGAELLLCSPDSDPRIWRDRLDVLRSGAYAGGKSDVLRFLEELVEAHHTWFEGVRE